MRDRTLEDPPADLKAWKQKVHAVDMALRTVQSEAATDGQQRLVARFSKRKPKLPFTRASSPSLL
jgi:hypothetical protein